MLSNTGIVHLCAVCSKSRAPSQSGRGMAGAHGALNVLKTEGFQTFLVPLSPTTNFVRITYSSGAPAFLSLGLSLCIPCSIPTALSALPCNTTTTQKYRSQCLDSSRSFPFPSFSLKSSIYKRGAVGAHGSADNRGIFDTVPVPYFPVVSFSSPNHMAAKRSESATPIAPHG